MTRDAILRHIAGAQADGDRWYAAGSYLLARVRWADAVHLRARLRSMTATHSELHGAP